MIPPLLALVFCAALFVLLFQYIFPRRAPWWRVLAGLVAGIAATLVLVAIMAKLAVHTLDAIRDVTSIPDAFNLALLRAALPEETTKAVAAFLALLPFRRSVTPAQAFQVAIVAALGFTLVENHGYVTAFSDYAVPVAFGRGFLASTIHCLLAMAFGGFLARFVANGWRGWHLPIVGYLLAVVCHALHDTGLLPIGAQFLATGDVDTAIVISMLPIILVSFPLTFLVGVLSLRHAIRSAAAGDAIVDEPRHQAVVRCWRWVGLGVLGIGVTLFVGAIAAGIAFGNEEAADTGVALLFASGLGAGLFLALVGWILRLKR